MLTQRQGLKKLSLKKVGLAFNDQFCDWHCNEERIILFQPPIEKERGRGKYLERGSERVREGGRQKNVRGEKETGSGER